MCGLALLDEDEIGYSDRFGLGKNLGLPWHDFYQFKKCKGI